MTFKDILLDNSDNICTITLNRPDSLNALNGNLVSELTVALERADEDTNCRVIILTGNEKAFAAGADIKEMAEKNFVEMIMSEFLGKIGHFGSIWPDCGPVVPSCGHCCPDTL